LTIKKKRGRLNKENKEKEIKQGKNYLKDKNWSTNVAFLPAGNSLELKQNRMIIVCYQGCL